MTTINVLRLDRHQGLLISDEARYWNSEWMIFYTPEKIRSVVPEEISREQGLYIFMGQTGTSSVGDEFMDRFYRALHYRYAEEKARAGGVPEKFLTIEQAMDIGYEVICQVKRTHVDDILAGRYGFTADELVHQGYERAGEKFEIADEEVAAGAYKLMANEGTPEDVTGIFGNSQVYAAYHPAEGFRIYYSTTRTPVMEEVREIFVAMGSGRDTVDLALDKFAASLPLSARAGAGIDRAAGLMALLKGLTTAFKQTMGIGGYPKIIWVNGHQQDPSKRVLEITDFRAKLAAEIVAAANNDLFPEGQARSLIDGLIFGGRPFAEVNREFLQRAPDQGKLLRFLRGYRNA